MKSRKSALKSRLPKRKSLENQTTTIFSMPVLSSETEQQTRQKLVNMTQNVPEDSLKNLSQPIAAVANNVFKTGVTLTENMLDDLLKEVATFDAESCVFSSGAPDINPNQSNETNDAFDDFVAVNDDHHNDQIMDSAPPSNSSTSTTCHLAIDDASPVPTPQTQAPQPAQPQGESVQQQGASELEQEQQEQEKVPPPTLPVPPTPPKSSPAPSCVSESNLAIAKIVEEMNEDPSKVMSDSCVEEVINMELQEEAEQDVSVAKTPTKVHAEPVDNNGNDENVSVNEIAAQENSTEDIEQSDTVKESDQNVKSQDSSKSAKVNQKQPEEDPSIEAAKRPSPVKDFIAQSGDENTRSPGVGETIGFIEAEAVEKVGEVMANIDATKVQLEPRRSTRNRKNNPRYQVPVSEPPPKKKQQAATKSSALQEKQATTTPRPPGVYQSRIRTSLDTMIQEDVRNLHIFNHVESGIDSSVMGYALELVEAEAIVTSDVVDEANECGIDLNSVCLENPEVLRELLQDHDGSTPIEVVIQNQQPTPFMEGIRPLEASDMSPVPSPFLLAASPKTPMAPRPTALCRASSLRVSNSPPEKLLASPDKPQTPAKTPMKKNVHFDLREQKPSPCLSLPRTPAKDRRDHVKSLFGDLSNSPPSSSLIGGGDSLAALPSLQKTPLKSALKKTPTKPPPPAIPITFSNSESSSSSQLVPKPVSREASMLSMDCLSPNFGTSVQDGNAHQQQMETESQQKRKLPLKKRKNSGRDLGLALQRQLFGDISNDSLSMTSPAKKPTTTASVPSPIKEMATESSAMSVLSSSSSSASSSSSGSSSSSSSSSSSGSPSRATASTSTTSRSRTRVPSGPGSSGGELLNKIAFHDEPGSHLNDDALNHVLSVVDMLKTPTKSPRKSPAKTPTSAAKRLKKSPLPSPFLRSPGGTPSKDISIASVGFTPDLYGHHPSVDFGGFDNSNLSDSSGDRLLTTPSPTGGGSLETPSPQDVTPPGPSNRINPTSGGASPNLKSSLSNSNSYGAPRTPKVTQRTPPKSGSASASPGDLVLSSPLKALNEAAKNLFQGEGPKKTFVFISPSKRLPRRATLVPVTTRSPLKDMFKSRWEAHNDVNNLDVYQGKVKEQPRNKEATASRKRKLSKKDSSSISSFALSTSTSTASTTSTASSTSTSSNDSNKRKAATETDVIKTPDSKRRKISESVDNQNIVEEVTPPPLRINPPRTPGKDLAIYKKSPKVKTPIAQIPTINFDEDLEGQNKNREEPIVLRIPKNVITPPVKTTSPPQTKVTPTTPGKKSANKTPRKVQPRRIAMENASPKKMETKDPPPKKKAAKQPPKPRTELLVTSQKFTFFSQQLWGGDD